MVELHIWKFPLTLLLTAVFFAVAFLPAWKFPRFTKKLADRRIAVCLMFAIAALVAVEGTWKLEIYHSLVFILLVVLFMLSLSAAVVYGVSTRKGLPFILCHAGVLLVVSGAFFGAPDVTDAYVMAVPGKERKMALTAEGEGIPLPFGISLVEFRTDYYDDGVSPRQYSSVIEADGQRMMTSVNHPCRYKGYCIYQFDYDHIANSYSVLKVVRDPWLPLVFIGMAVLALGAIAGLGNVWKNRLVFPSVAVLSVIFGILSLSNINFGTLAPALRSLWFVPHLIIYMIAYSVLALSLVSGAVSLFGREKAGEMSRKLLATASVFLLVGMLCGAVWAKSAWGQYWTWDAKECWAAVTWLLTQVGLHLTPGKKAGKMFFLIVLSAFLAMQITWYGVNYLPSSQYSIHTYNRGE